MTAPEDKAVIQTSISNGLHWQDVWQSSTPGEGTADLNLVNEVNGAYEVLVRVVLQGKAVFSGLDFKVITAINSKTQPQLKLGRNTVYVGRGSQTDSIVLWPELQEGRYKDLIVDEKNIACAGKHPGYMGVLHLAQGNQEGYITYRIDAPREITRLTYGGRFYNRARDSRADIMHSLDGKTWTTTWSLTSLEAPWDTIHYETADIPAGNTSVMD